MKRNLTIIYLMLGLLVGVNYAQAQSIVTIGTGTAGQRQPLGCWFGYERAAAIYTAAEIGDAAPIQKISWYINSQGTTATPYSIKIYLKHTSATSFPVDTMYAVEAAGAKLVYADSAVFPTGGASGGWFDFTLNDTFNYNGTSNLQVIVETNSGGGGIGNQPRVRYSAATANSLQTWTQDNTPPTGKGTRTGNRPNIRLHFSPYAYTDFSPKNMVSAIGNCAASSYTLQFIGQNMGTGVLPSGSYIRYSYSLNGASAVTDSIRTTYNINFQDTFRVRVNNIALPNNVASTIKVWLKHNQDLNRKNDTAMYSVFNAATCLSQTTNMDFQAGPSGWTTNSLWIHGNLNRPPFDISPGGTPGWMTGNTNPYPDGARAYLYSPFLDLSTTTCIPQISWDMRFETEPDYDGLIVEISEDNTTWTRVTTVTPGYNNNSNYGPITVAKYSGDNTTWQSYSANLNAWKGKSGIRLRFYFASDGSGGMAGIAIDNIFLGLKSSYTGTSFTSPDSFYTNSVYDTEIFSTSPAQLGVTFAWELNGTQVGTSPQLPYVFTTPGTYTLKYVAKDACGLRLDSFTKTIRVVNPTRKPTADFISDVNTAALLDLVSFQNLSDQGPTDYFWVISPEMVFDAGLGYFTDAYYYQNGTDNTSKNPVVAFYYAGLYDVCLVASNGLGSDTLCKTEYIKVGGTTALTGSDSLMCSGSITTLTSGTVYDSGGPNNDYTDYENCSFVIDFSCYDSLRLRWNMFELEDGFDYLGIFDGDEFTGTPLWDLNAFPNGITGIGVLNNNDFYAVSGKVTILMITDVSIQEAGFNLSYEMLSRKSVPVASFDAPDTVCASYFVDFINTSVSGSTYEWDYFGTGTNMGSSKDGLFVYGTAGVYNVRLIVTNCVGADTFIKQIVVVHPASMLTEFGADKLKPTTNDVVTFTDSTKGCVDSYQWVIEPNTFTVVRGSLSDPTFTVTFDQPGFYDIKLFTSNSVTTDSMWKTAYIEVSNICIPMLSNSVRDMGISHIEFADLRNNTTGGNGYTDYPEMQANVMAGATYPLLVERPSTSNEITRKVWIDYNADGDFNDAGELVAMDGPSRNKSLISNITIPRSAYIGTVTIRVATSYSSYANDPCSNRNFGETQDYRVHIIKDNILPVITLSGQANVTINVNDSYSDDGATASDNIDGNITAAIVTVNPVITTVPGTYIISYDVTDSAGNAAVTVTREVIVLPEAPTITLLGLNPDTLNVFDSYGDLGVDGRDYKNDILQYTVTGMLDSSVVGTYTLTYTVTDDNGRSSNITRDIVVVDKVSPTAALIGDDTVTVEVFGTFDDPGLALSDNYCTPSLISYTTQPVSYDVLGFTTITYDIIDCNGNTSTITRTVRVVDTEAPVIKLRGPLTVNVMRHRPYSDSGFVVNDNYYSRSGITVDTITTLPNTENPGLFTYQYKATDGSGNVSYSETRFVYIIDNVSVKEVESKVLNVYPNPAKSDVTITTDHFEGENVRIAVIDMYGKVVMAEQITQFNGTVKLKLGDLASGVYMITLVNGNNQATARVVLNK